MIYGYRLFRRGNTLTILNTVVGLIALVAVMMTAAACSDEPENPRFKHLFTQVYEFGENKLEYTDDISEELARRLGDYLLSKGWDEGEATQVRLAKSGDTYEFYAVFDEDLIERRDVVHNAVKMAEYLSLRVFEGAKVEIHLCDNEFQTLKIVQGQQG